MFIADRLLREKRIYKVSFVKVVCFLLGNTEKFIEIFPKIIYNMYAVGRLYIVRYYLYL